MALVSCASCGREISKKAASCPNCGQPGKRKTSPFTWFVIIVLGFSSLGVAVQNSTSAINSAGSTGQSPRDIALQKTTLKYEWGKGGFDTVMMANFTIKNDSPYSFKDFTVKCTHFAQSGTEIDSNKKTVYQEVKAHTTKKIHDFNMGFIHSQAASSSCEITDLVVLGDG